MAHLLKQLVLAPAGRRSKWLIIVVWLVIAVLTLPFTGKLNDVSTDSAAQFLPHSAESAKLVAAQNDLKSKQTFDITVVYKKQAGGLINSDDQAAIAAVQSRLVARYPNIDKPAPVAFSTDQTEALITLYIPQADIRERGKTYADSEVDAIKSIRALSRQGVNGFEVKVTGNGAYEADTKIIDKEVNGPLLIGTLIVVTLVLLLTYRSPILWLLPILVVGFGDGLASWVIYTLAKGHHMTLDGQSANIVPVLAFGVGTDYALLLLSRYRDELRHNEDHHDAMTAALAKSGTTILASATIVVFAMLSLLFSELHSNQALAVVGALSIGFVGIASATLLPALMVVCGRRAFWPLIPRFGSEQQRTSIWSRIGQRVVAKPSVYAAGTTAALVVVAIAGLSIINTNLKQIDSFRKSPDSVVGTNLIKQSFAGSQHEPLFVVTNTREATQVLTAIANSPTVSVAAEADESIPGPNAQCAPNPYNEAKCSDLNGKTEYAIKMVNDPDSPQGHKDIKALRTAIHNVPGADAVLGSGGALRMDLADAAKHDQQIIIPLMLIAALVVFSLLLRAFVAPVILILTTVVSYCAALGGGVLLSRYAFGFPAEDSSLVLISFVFLVALGIDYNMFLAARTKEDANSMPMRDATLSALTSTGSVITSAGAVLAATFLVLATTDVVFVTQLGVTVAFGVLLDTLIVRTILVPALFVMLGNKTWWPSHLAAPKRPRRR